MRKYFRLSLIIAIASPAWSQAQSNSTPAPSPTPQTTAAQPPAPTPQTTATPTPAPAAAIAQTVPQSAQTESTPDKQKLDSLAQDAKTIAAAQDEKIAGLQSKLDAFQAQLAAVPNGNTIAALSSRVKALEDLQNAQQALVVTQSKQALTNLSRQYQAGYAVLSLMDDQAHRLEFAFQLSASISDFQDAVNPMNNPAFKTDVDALLAKQSTGVIGSITSNQSVQALAAANPYVSLGVSIASYFTSKVSTDKKDPKLVEIGCIVNLGTGSLAATQQIQAQLATVRTNIIRFEKSSDSAFSTYTKMVNYTKSIDDYRKEQNTLAIDPLAQPVSDAFKDGGVATTPAGLSNTRYQLEQVKNQLAQFDNLIQGVGDFISKFDAVLSDQAKAFAQSKCADEASKKLGVLQTSVANLKPEFDNGNWNVSAPQRALVIGAAAQ